MPAPRELICERCHKPFMAPRNMKFCHPCKPLAYAARRKAYFDKTREDMTPLVMVKTKMRTCLSCNRSFPSEGAWNRICPRCVYSRREYPPNEPYRGHTVLPNRRSIKEFEDERWVQE